MMSRRSAWPARSRSGAAPDIVRRLNAETDKFMRSKEAETRLANEGAHCIPMTPGQFGNFVKAEITKWAPVVKASGAKGGLSFLSNGAPTRRAGSICRSLHLPVDRPSIPRMLGRRYLCVPISHEH